MLEKRGTTGRNPTKGPKAPMGPRGSDGVPSASKKGLRARGKIWKIETPPEKLGNIFAIQNDNFCGSVQEQRMHH